MTRSSRRALRFSPLAIVFTLALASCGDDTNFVAPEVTDPPERVTAPAPAEAAPEITPASSSRAITSSSPCSLPMGNRGRFYRALSTAVPGSYPLSSEAGWSECTTSPEDPDNVFAFEGDTTAFSWTASVPVGGVVLWSGTRGVIYEYATRSRADAALVGPTDPATGELLPIDAITLCHDYELGTSTTFETSTGVEVSWSLAAAVQPSEWDLRPGDRATSRATIDLQRDETGTLAPFVTATVEVSNPSPLTTHVTSSYAIVGGRLAMGTASRAMPLQLTPGATAAFVFALPLASTDPVSFVAYLQTDGLVPMPSIQSTVVFDDVDAPVQLVSSDGQRLGPFDASAQVTLDRVFVADAEGTERIDWDLQLEDEDLDAVSIPVDVRVHAPVIHLEPVAHFTRYWGWQLDVAPSPSWMDGPFGLVASIEATATPIVARDADFALGGRLFVTNPHPSAPLSPDVVRLDVDGARRDFTSSAPIPAAGDVEFDVDLPLMHGAGSAVVALTWTSREFSPDGTATDLGPVSTTGTVPLAFVNPTEQIDARAIVRDSNAGEIGAVRAENGPVALTAELPIDPSTPCGPQTLTGDMELVTDDAGTVVNRDYAFEIELPCDGLRSCTQKARYWRRHPNDSTWERLAEGTETRLFDSRYTWYTALRPNLRGGVYGQLAREFVAARLNGLSGADTAAIDDALGAGAEMLRKHDRRSLRGRDVARALRLTWVLARYNAGRIGPGRCMD